MATPATLFRPNPQPEPVKVVATQRSTAASKPQNTETPEVLLAPSAGAVEFDTVISASGQLNVIPSVQRIRLGAERAGLREASSKS
ncbi:hypothetical protein ABH930_007295 [Kitasatospora sp. GAS204A]|nr:hypothetical protein [Kitasatospora sp. GAS204B]